VAVVLKACCNTTDPVGQHLEALHSVTILFCFSSGLRWTLLPILWISSSATSLRLPRRFLWSPLLWNLPAPLLLRSLFPEVRLKVCFCRRPPRWRLGQRGGGKVGSTLGLVYIGNVSSICGGVIQNSGQSRFCCKEVGVCSTKGHKDKVNIQAETLYVKHTRNGHARLTPSLPTKLLPEDVSVEDIMGKELRLDV
jgi:hypothetical protein